MRFRLCLTSRLALPVQHCSQVSAGLWLHVLSMRRLAMHGSSRYGPGMHGLRDCNSAGGLILLSSSFFAWAKQWSVCLGSSMHELSMHGLNLACMADGLQGSIPCRFACQSLHAQTNVQAQARSLQGRAAPCSEPSVSCCARSGWHAAVAPCIAVQCSAAPCLCPS